jgi:hypothetical protein
MKLKKTIRELRKEQYAYHSRLYPYLDDWKKNPYTWFKSRFYMETSAILLWFLVRTDVKPNSVTLMYGLLGIIGGILLAIPCTITIIAAIVVFFTKGILDWSDGHLARIKKQESLTGHILDCYGAHVNSLGLQVGLGFYVAFKGGPFYYYIIPLIPLLYSLSITDFSYSILFKSLSKTIKKTRVPVSAAKNESCKPSVVPQWYKLITSFLDDRARSVDFILLIVALELIYPSFFITWLILILLIIKRFIICSGKFYLLVWRSWAEKVLDAEAKDITNTICS